MSLDPVPLKTAEFSPSSPQRFIAIDEDGYFKMSAADSAATGTRVTDEATGREWLSKLQHNPNEFRTWTRIENQDVIVEAFDAPYIALSLEKSNGSWIAHFPYGYSEPFALATLTLDEWDRFHGYTSRGIPFVMSRAAQAAFFDQLDSFDDESIEVDGATYALSTWLNGAGPPLDFWAEKYRAQQMPWDLSGPHPALPRLASAIKVQRSRILVLGCGRGHDAAWFARAGHIVTAIDYSEDALNEARKLYGDVKDLSFVQADAFQLPTKFDQVFDLVFDHTLYCAIDPSGRNDLVKSWRRALTENGHLLGIFFCSEKLKGPPYGGSEWELRQRFQKHFRPLYWQRLKESPDDDRLNRLGSEIFIYAQKLSALR